MDIRLLLIEDEKDQALMIKALLDLSPRNFIIEVISNPVDLDLTTISEYDIVLCDYNLPGKNGIEVIEEILENHQIPIIMMTGIDEKEIIVEAFRRGAQDYVIKSDSMLEILPFIISKNLIDFKARTENQFAKEEKVRLEVRNQTLQQMMTTLSHYINNSTTAISGFAQLCKFSPGDDNFQKLIEVIQKETLRISAVLAELEVLAERANIKTTDYVGLTDAMFDIGDAVQNRLNNLISDN